MKNLIIGLKHQSGNTVSELSCMVAEIELLIERDYSHVSEALPKSFIKQLARIRKELDTETERREELAYN